MQNIGINNTMNISFSEDKESDRKSNDKADLNNIMKKNIKFDYHEDISDYSNTFLVNHDHNNTIVKSKLNTEYDPIADSFYELPLLQINKKNEVGLNNHYCGSSINNTMKQNINNDCNNDSFEDDNGDNNGDFSQDIHSINFLFDSKDIDEYDNGLSSFSNVSIQNDTNPECDISYLFKINKQLNYSTDKPLWYILNENNYSSFGPISSVGLLTLFRENKITGSTRVRLLDIFRPIDKTNTYIPLREIARPNFLLDYYAINNELEEIISNVYFPSITITNKPKNKNKNKKRIKGKELVITHKFE